MKPVVTIILVVIVVIAIAAALMWARRRSLKNRFGPEYDRAVSEQDSRHAAERELRARERRHAELEITPLDPASRDRYATQWRSIQERFVEEPNEAVAAADELVTQLIAERGYPTGDYDEQVAHLSVDHARTLGHYRDAHDINLSNQRGEASTEQLRQALVHYRALFEELLGEETARDATHRPTHYANDDQADMPVDETGVRMRDVPQDTNRL